MTTTRVYKSTDASAPTLPGQVGALKDLLKKILVGTSGVAYGTGPSQKLAAGWSNAFPAGETTTKIAFRNSLAAGGSGMYARLLDDGSMTGGAKEAGLFSYAAMTDVDTGTDQAPTTAQMSAGVVLRKSATADGTARPWIVIADERTFYIWIDSLPGTNTEKTVGGAGDFESLVAGDGYAYFSVGCSAQNTNGRALAALGCGTAFDASTSGWFVGRTFAQTGTAVIARPVSSAGMANVAVLNAIGGNQTTQADPGPNGKRMYMPLYLGHNGGYRGRLRGMYGPLNNLIAVAGGTMDTGVVAPGSDLVILSCFGNSGTSSSTEGRLAVETVLPWS